MSKNNLTIEEKISRLATGSVSLKDLPEKIKKVIGDNLEEALRSNSPYIKQTAEKLKK
jgi:hypothetical protein